jgi:hypothetical protein
LCTSRPTNDLVCICLPLLTQENRTPALSALEKTYRLSQACLPCFARGSVPD